MAKKYLLYIHNPKFDLENEKSNLVNLLLDRHYDFYKPGTMVETVSDESIVGNAELAGILKDAPTTKITGQYAPEIREANNLCLHGADRRFCKHAKPGKPCRD